MEQAKYWMWTRREQPNDHQLQLSNAPTMAFRLPPISPAIMDGRSWEERAFAEDTAGVLGGGCIWPPRAYPCTFCGREFRSAQALGGHMNVHRRDRARMKQSLIPEVVAEDEQELLVNPNPNPNPNPSFGDFEAVLPSFGEEMRLGEMDFIRLMKRNLDEEEDEIEGSFQKRKKNSVSPGVVEETLDLELRLGDLPKVK